MASCIPILLFSSPIVFEFRTVNTASSTQLPFANFLSFIGIIVSSAALLIELWSLSDTFSQSVFQIAIAHEYF
jgi:hypothetical protein